MWLLHLPAEIVIKKSAQVYQGEGVCTLDIDILAFRLYYTFNKISADTEITMTFLRDESLGGKSDPNQQTGAIRADPSTQNSFQRK